MIEVTVKTIHNTLNRPDDYQVSVGNQEPLILDLDDARKLRDALCIMVGMPPRREPKRKRAK